MLFQLYRKDGQEKMKVKDEQIWQIYKEEVGKAGEKNFTPQKEFKSEVFKIWVETIHRIILLVNCPCQKNKMDFCFLKLSPNDQINLFVKKEMLSWQFFLKNAKETREKFLSCLESRPSSGHA